MPRLWALVCILSLMLATEITFGSDKAGSQPLMQSDEIPAPTDPGGWAPQSRALVTPPARVDVPSQESTEIGPSAVWEPAAAGDDRSTAIENCRQPNRIDCAVDVMMRFGASPEAVAFFRETQWFLVEFEELGKVDLGLIDNPWAANSPSDFALLNGSPRVVIVVTELASSGFGSDQIRADPHYDSLARTYPELIPWVGDQVFESAGPSAEGGQVFIFQVDLNDGCHACFTGYTARVALGAAPDGTHRPATFLNICWRGAGFLTPVDPTVPECPPAQQPPGAETPSPTQTPSTAPLTPQETQPSGTTERVSVSSHGDEANGDSGGPALSADGRFVAFSSTASNLVPGDTNAVSDVFIHDRIRGTTERVSIDSLGNEGNGGSSMPALSGDGRFVAFVSDASNLVPGDTNAVRDAFVHDRETGATTIVSVSGAGAQGNALTEGKPAISRDGRFVAFDSFSSNLVERDSNGEPDVFVRDRDADNDGVFDEQDAVSTIRVSLSTAGGEGNGTSAWPAISDDGRFIAFTSNASNLVDGDTNQDSDTFLRDRDADDDGIFDEPGAVSTVRVNVNSSGAQADAFTGLGVAIDNNGHVAFSSSGSNLVPGDTNNLGDVFAHDAKASTTERVSVDSSGREGSDASGGEALAMSADGRFVAFDSVASNLVPGDTNVCPGFATTPGRCRDIFVHDRETGATFRVSVSSAGEQGNHQSSDPALSADGSVIAFRSRASNLVPGDTSTRADIFVRELSVEGAHSSSPPADEHAGSGALHLPQWSIVLVLGLAVGTLILAGLAALRVRIRR